MSKKKTCESFLCSNKTQAKYRYCYKCAKSKGHIGGTNWVGWILLAIILMAVFG